MKYVLVSVHDRAAECFGRPMFVVSLGQAIRSFTDEVNRNHEDNQMYRHSNDFDLYNLGLFDDSTGLFELHKPELTLRGAQAKTPVST